MTEAAKTGQGSLIALDWGTSSLRAFLMDADGSILDKHASGHGIQKLPLPGKQGFEKALADIRQGWPRVPVIAGGMVGSAQGWKEAPYLPCPADSTQLARAAVRVSIGSGEEMLIAPGMAYLPCGGQPDVMRGEEIQIAGALAAFPDLGVNTIFVLPGTHSKWVEVVNGRVRRFSTYMTGEIYAVMVHHSILGRLMSETPPQPEDATKAFREGVATAAKDPAQLQHSLFSARTLGLTGRMTGDLLRDYLSGLLIGNEIAASRAKWQRPGAPLVLIGEPQLCRRYAEALGAFGVEPAQHIENSAPLGLFHLASEAGLLSTGAAERRG